MKYLVMKNDALAWSEEHHSGDVDSFSGHETFTNTVDCNSLKEVLRMRVETPCYGYHGFVRIEHAEVMKFLEANGVVIDADYYRALIDTTNTKEVLTYQEIDDNYPISENGKMRYKTVYEITNYEMVHSYVVIFYKAV